MTTPKRPSVTQRQAVKALADTSGIALDDVDRAIVLGQIAEFLAASSKVGGRVAFKGGAIMTLVESSARLSRDLDSSLVMHTGRRVTLEEVEAALSTPEARKVVRRVERKGVTFGSSQLRVPVIVCHPKSGVGDVQVAFSVNWSEPILLEPVLEDVTIDGRQVRLRVMARPERVAEKVRTYLNRGEPRDVYDLYVYALTWLTPAIWTQLPDLIARKLLADPKAPQGAQARVIFDENTAARAVDWESPRNPLRLLNAKIPPWAEVAPVLEKYKTRLP
jgi:Nucleotidyl transferase AbiEii toxin, Type IV TA system